MCVCFWGNILFTFAKGLLNNGNLSKTKCFAGFYNVIHCYSSFNYLLIS